MYTRLNYDTNINQNIKLCHLYNGVKFVPTQHLLPPLPRPPSPPIFQLPFEKTLLIFQHLCTFGSIDLISWSQSRSQSWLQGNLNNPDLCHYSGGVQSQENLELLFEGYRKHPFLPGCEQESPQPSILLVAIVQLRMKSIQ